MAFVSDRVDCGRIPPSVIFTRNGAGDSRCEGLDLVVGWLGIGEPKAELLQGNGRGCSCDGIAVERQPSNLLGHGVLGCGGSFVLQGRFDLSRQGGLDLLGRGRLDLPGQGCSDLTGQGRLDL